MGKGKAGSQSGGRRGDGSGSGAEILRRKNSGSLSSRLPNRNSAFLPSVLCNSPLWWRTESQKSRVPIATDGRLWLCMVAPAALLDEKLPPSHWGLGQAHSHLHMGPGTGAGGATGSKDRFVLINQKRFCCLSQLGLWGKRRLSGRVIKVR